MRGKSTDRPKVERTAHQYALDLLSVRAYTRRSLEKKLFSKGYSPQEITDELSALEATRILDDEKFAYEYARQKLTSGGKSVRRVERELIQKGIASPRAKAAIESVVADEAIDTDASLDAAGRKKLATLVRFDKNTQKRRLFSFLARRGFESDAINRFVTKTVK